jgi:hypothetical protein
MFTSLTSALLPAPLFLGASVGFWVFAQCIFSSLMPKVELTPWLPGFGSLHRTVELCGKLIQHMVENYAVPALFPAVAALLLGLLLVLGGTLPSILVELIPPKAGENPTATQKLGNWLDAGYAALCAGAIVGWLGFLVMPPIDAIGWYFDIHWIQWWLHGTYGARLTEAVTGASAVTFLAATRMFAQGLEGAVGDARVVIDTLQDVDNWLRERPRNQTIRLEIFSRYYALLQYIAEQGYDKIVIGAHSQGTVITADFLRYLTAKCLMPERASNIGLLTYGSPLRQLYRWRLPYFYSWANGTLPELEKFGLKDWVNAYGSGDYIGRNLEKDDIGRVPCTKQNRFGLITRLPKDRCIGPLAHLHYLDAENHAIAKLFNDMIVEDMGP